MSPRAHRVTARLGVAVGCALAALTLAACSGGTTISTTIPVVTGPTTAPTTPATTGPTTPTGALQPSKAADGLVWVLTAAALRDVATDPTALSVVEAGRIFEIVGRNGHTVRGVTATPTQDFKSEATLAAAVSSGDLYPGVEAVLYDPESWVFTPQAERADVGLYTSRAAAIARQHSLELIATPALDLVAIAGQTMAGRVATFLSDHIDGSVAAAGVVDIQAQNTEQDSTGYAAFVKAAASQIHSTSPSTVVIAGLTTNNATAPDLEAAIRDTEGVAAGYWLNIPSGPSSSCPQCGPADPQIAITALDAVFG